MARTPLFHWMRTMIRRAMVTVEPDLPLNASQSSDTGPASMTRRDFLKSMMGAAGTIAAVSMLPTASFGAASTPVGSPKASISPVIIVGAGLGGLVTAYRLMRKGIPCEIYEAAHRPGGRVFTRHNFNRQGMFVELGGELVDTVHDDLIGLCDELNVPLERFEEPNAGIAPALYFSEGKVYTESDVLKAFEPLAKNLAADILRCFPDGEIHVPTFQNPYNATWLDQMTLEAYLDSQKQAAPWLIRLIKAAYTGEYGLDPADQSALNLLVLIGTDTQAGFRMFGDSDEAMRIQGGNTQLVSALVSAIEGKVPIHYGFRLTELQNRHDGLHLWFESERDTRHAATEQAVLAIPFSVLREISGLNELGLSALKLKCIREWGYGTNSKQMMGFHSRFWRQSFPSAVETGMRPNSGELFTDLPSQCYWETSRMQTGSAGILTNFLGGKAGRDAERNQWQSALRDLSLLYPHIQDEADQNRAFFNWFRNPYAKGSYTCPRPGQYTSLMGVAGLTELDGRLFFAGEHCSVDWAGFMNGAVQSGNVTALQVSGLRTALVPAKA